MKVTVDHIDGRLAAESPGMSAFQFAADPVTGLLGITCLVCGQVTARYLVAGDEYDIRHRPDCRLEQTIAREVAKDPRRVGKTYLTLDFRVGEFRLAVRESLPLAES